MLKIPQMYDRSAFLKHWSHVELLQFHFMNYNDTFKALTKSLKLKMASPLSIFLHEINIVFEWAVFLFIQKRFKELLMSYHILAGLLSHDDVWGLWSIDLVCKCSKKAVSVSYNIFEFDFEGSYLFVKGRVVLNIDVGEFECIGFGHFLSHFDLHLSVCLSLHPGLLNHSLLVFLFSHGQC